ncbi:hypothetical protein CLAUDI_26 [Bacillus phage Claudi]|uniref:Uncharacterized protein n=1 Tax=Bacillus phage Claudi TaxID=1874001 RepID=A0A1B1PAI9_9CAUD|nr:hypothetical protein MUK67_gp26 [Bacillus phage Claudi]ANT41180.1 hypothetical protein CLAUDI_26 [Bacillus phage Claudi]
MNDELLLNFISLLALKTRWINKEIEFETFNNSVKTFSIVYKIDIDTVILSLGITPTK